MGRTIRSLAGFLALVAVCASGEAVAVQRPMYPPEVGDVEWTRLPRGEPALWPPETLRCHRSRMRLTIAGIAFLRVSIRIDEDRRGRFRGRAVLINGRGIESPPIVRFFRPSAAAMERLREAIRAARLWTFYPEHWVFTDPNAICLDGEQMVFERHDAEGYRFSEANAQCTAPPALLEVGRLLIEMARVPEARGLI